MRPVRTLRQRPRSAIESKLAHSLNHVCCVSLPQTVDLKVHVRQARVSHELCELASERTSSSCYQRFARFLKLRINMPCWASALTLTFAILKEVPSAVRSPRFKLRGEISRFASVGIGTRIKRSHSPGRQTHAGGSVNVGSDGGFPHSFRL